jgi:general secretion pathway protein F
MLILVGTLVVLFLLLYVVPKFSAIYEAKSNHLPWLSQLLLGWGRLLHAHAQEAVLGMAGLISLTLFALTRPFVRRILVDAFWRIPALGERFRIYQLARFYRTLGMLLRGGIPVVTALDMVQGLLQPQLRERLVLAIGDIREGKPISGVMETRGLTTPVAAKIPPNIILIY